jgi:hypothetical protein
MTVARYELRSAAELDALARTPLPLGIRGGEPRHTTHRDVYLDTPDDALRARGIVCRLRIGARSPHRLSLRIPGAPVESIDARVRSADPAEAVGQDTAVRRRLLALVDPSALVARTELEVERITRRARRDLLGRPRLELHCDRVTVRRNGDARTRYQLCVHHRHGAVEGFRQLVTALEREHDLTGPAGDAREQAELLLRWMRPAPVRQRFASVDESSPIGDETEPPEMLTPELSLLAFQRRVLAIAEDPRTPLRERLRFIGIVTSNLDEFHMVRIPELRQAAADRSGAAHERGIDGLTAGDRLDRVEREIAALVDAQSRCAADCLREAEALGTTLLRWGDLTESERHTLRARCRDEIYPALTPLAMTLSPGHPLPHLPHLGLSLAVVFRQAGGEGHLAELELPSDTERFVAVPGRAHAVVPVEEVLRGNVDLLYPNARVDGA